MYHYKPLPVDDEGVPAAITDRLLWDEVLPRPPAQADDYT